MLLGWGERKSTKYRGTYAQFFLRCGLDCFSSIFFLQILSPPSPPHNGSAVFWALGWLRLALQLLCPPPPPLPPTWEPYQSNKRMTRKCKTIVWNKVFECLTFTVILKIEVRECGKYGLQNGLKCILRDIDFKKYPGVVPQTPFNKKGVNPLPQHCSIQAFCQTPTPCPHHPLENHNLRTRFP